MTELPVQTEIVIVGAGPVGLSLAIALHQRGAAPVLLEKRTETANTSRAAVVHARTLEMLAPLDVVPDLLDRGIRVPTFCVRDRDQVLIEVGFADLKTAYPFTLMCPKIRPKQSCAVGSPQSVEPSPTVRRWFRSKARTATPSCPSAPIAA